LPANPVEAEAKALPYEGASALVFTTAICGCSSFASCPLNSSLKALGNRVHGLKQGIVPFVVLKQLFWTTD